MTRTPDRRFHHLVAMTLLAGLLSACGADPGVVAAPALPEGDPGGAPSWQAGEAAPELRRHRHPPVLPVPAPVPPDVPPAPPAEPAAPATPPAPRVATQRFACVGMLAPAHVRQRVTGGLTALGEPVDVAFVKASTSSVTASGAEPQANPGYDGGYWKASYGFDAWTVATDDLGTTWTLLFPPGPYPFRFEAMAVTDYGAGGNYQDQLTCGIL